MFYSYNSSQFISLDYNHLTRVSGIIWTQATMFSENSGIFWSQGFNTSAGKKTPTQTKEELIALTLCQATVLAAFIFTITPWDKNDYYLKGVKCGVLDDR